MFDFERRSSQQGTNRIVASEAQKLTVEQRQRDVYESHRHRVFAVSYYMTSDEMEAETLLADTFVTAFASQSEPDATGVDKALLNQLEQRFSFDPVEPATLDRALQLTRDVNRRTDMEEAMRTLPAPERLVFLLKDVEGYPTARIAGVMEIEEREVQCTLMSARIRMRNALAAMERKAKEARAPEEGQKQRACLDDQQMLA